MSTSHGRQKRIQRSTLDVAQPHIDSQPRTPDKNCCGVATPGLAPRRSRESSLHDRPSPRKLGQVVLRFFENSQQTEPCLREAVQRAWCNLPANYNWDICTQQNYAASEAVIIPGKLEGRADGVVGCCSLRLTGSS